jgi:7-carboxy-7-deazaguanine synthase
VESNGTLSPPLCPPGVPWNYRSQRRTIHDRNGVYVVCSPKTAGLNRNIFDVACALKYVVRAGEVGDDGLPDHALGHPSRPARPPKDWDRLVYVQPMDEQDPELNRANLDVAIASSIQHGYTLQLQIHKLIGVE